MNYQPLLLPICVLLVTACSNQAAYEEESFAIDSPFKRKVEGVASAVCESARRSLLGQGYLIETATEEEIKARKATKAGDSQNTFIEMNIVCLPETKGTTLFATGLLSEYALKKNSSSASVGVSALGSISLPIGQSADSLVKVSEVTIENKDFYQRFFAAVTAILEEMEAGQIALEPELEPAEPAVAGTTQSESPPLESTAAEPDPIDPTSLAAPEEPAPAIEPALAIPTEAAPGDDASEMTIEEILGQGSAIMEEPLPAEKAPTEVVPETERITPSTVSKPESMTIPDEPETSSDPLDELF